MLSANFVQRDPGIGLHICSNLREIHVEIELEAPLISINIPLPASKFASYFGNYNSKFSKKSPKSQIQNMISPDHVLY